MKRLFGKLSPFEAGLLTASLLAITVSFFVAGSGEYLYLAASYVGAVALIFVAKGNVLGQILTVVFSILYGVISFSYRYYGEMITYLGMTMPIAAATVVAWLRHPYHGTAEVQVNQLKKREYGIIFLLSLPVTALFFCILRALGTANLAVSTLSVFTSFVAVVLTLRRSAFYALAYAANDLVLIVLWILASIQNPAYVSMVACFAAFLVNDSYGFFHWQRMKKSQR